MAARTPAAAAGAGTSAARLRWYLIWTYIFGSAAAVAVTFFLIGLGLEFSLLQWMHFLVLACFVIPCYTLPDIYLIGRHVHPITSVLAVVDRGERPTAYDASRAIVRALGSADRYEDRTGRPARRTRLVAPFLQPS
jgi:hypothetical protein